MLSTLLLTLVLFAGNATSFLLLPKRTRTITASRIVDPYCTTKTTTTGTYSSTTKVSRHAIIVDDLIGIEHLSTSSSSSLLLVSDESWRQFVPLVVIGIVIVDILLGSPLANMALAPLRTGQAQDDNDDDGRNESNSEKSKERIDSEKVAKAALERAQNVKELKDMLEKQKTDWDRMEELKRSLDKEMQNLDEELSEHQKFLDQRK